MSKYIIHKAEFLKSHLGMEVGEFAHRISDRLVAGVFTLSTQEAVRLSKIGVLKLWLKHEEKEDHARETTSALRVVSQNEQFENRVSDQDNRNKRAQA